MLKGFETEKKELRVFDWNANLCAALKKAPKMVDFFTLADFLHWEFVKTLFQNIRLRLLILILRPKSNLLKDKRRHCGFYGY